MRPCFIIILIGLMAFSLPGTTGDTGEKLTGAEFLALTRQPFLTSAWGRFKGYVQYKNDKKTVKADLTLSVMMHPDYLRAQFILEGKDVYTVTQAYADGGMSNVQITSPEKVEAIPLEDLGITVSDITFSFLYWDYIEELKPDTIRGQRCRVLRVRNPQTVETAKIWLSAKYAGPLRVEFYNRQGTSERTLEFTDFKREGDLYYVKTAQLRGKDWKTRVKFKEADLAESANRPPPDDLFR